MKKIFFFSLIIIFNISATISYKNKIITNLENVQNLTFNFEQNINGKVENGNCTIQYPKKIYCEYDSKNKKILVANGKSLVIKTNNPSYYLYPIDKTPLNLILDKNFLINEIKNINERIIDDKFINYNFVKDEIEINLFFDNNNYDLVGWQTLDIYQNLSITYLSTIVKNKKIKENLFLIPQFN
jgi:outer membrane lipoprotein-sorting protein